MRSVHGKPYSLQHRFSCKYMHCPYREHIYGSAALDMVIGVRRYTCSRCAAPLLSRLMTVRMSIRVPHKEGFACGVEQLRKQRALHRREQRRARCRLPLGMRLPRSTTSPSERRHRNVARVERRLVTCR